MIEITDYQAKYYAYELTRRLPLDSAEKFAAAVAGAQVDLNPHQVDAALFAFSSPLAKGALLADEVGLGKTIEAGLVISQRWAEQTLVYCRGFSTTRICLGSKQKQGVEHLQQLLLRRLSAGIEAKRFRHLSSPPGWTTQMTASQMVSNSKIVGACHGTTSSKTLMGMRKCGTKTMSWEAEVA